MPTFPNFCSMSVGQALKNGIIVAFLLMSFYLFTQHYGRSKSNIVDDVYLSSAEVIGSKYAEMKSNLKVYIYPDEYHNAAFLKTIGYYAVEDHFIKNLRESSFVTGEPKDAQLFFIPFSFHRMRYKVLSNEEIVSNFRRYMEDIIIHYPHWNRTLDSNHFLLSCYSNDIEVTRPVPLVVLNLIRLVCWSNYSAGFVPRKDITIPSVLQPFSNPSKGKATEDRTILAYWAGVGNSYTRNTLVKLWRDDEELDIKSEFNLSVRTEKLQSAKFCICPVGSRNSNSRITMTILNGCVPVILENHIDLPFSDVLDLEKFSILLDEAEIYHLKDILKSKAALEYRMLYTNLLKVQHHFYFHWDTPPVEHDAFHMIMYKLWLRVHF